MCVCYNYYYVCVCPCVQGVLCRTLQGHGHWVNTMALSTDYSLRTGAFDPADNTLSHRGIEGLSCKCVCVLVKKMIETLSP